MFVFWRFSEVLVAGMDGFGKVPIRCKGHVGISSLVLLALTHTYDKSFVVGCVHQLVDDRQVAVLLQME
jgi:hypothetical protein